MTRSGAAYHSLPRCKYFEQLQFLSDKISNKDTVSNVQGYQSEIDIESPTQSSSSHSSESLSKRKIDTTPVYSTSVKKRKSDSQNQLDLLTLQCLQQTNEMLSQEKCSETEDENSDLLFFKSLLTSMKNLSRKKNRIARKKIMDIIFDLEYDSN